MTDEGSNIPKSKARVDIEASPRLTGTSAFKQSLGNLTTDLIEPGLVLASGGTAAQAAWAGLRGILLTRVLGPLGLISGAVIGIGAAIKIVTGQTRLMVDGLREAERMETLVTMFTPLLGGAQAAKQRLAELFQFAETTPFSIKGIAESSRLLEIMTQGALATTAGLRMIGDAAAIAGQPLEEVSFWVGRLYDGLKSNAPIGRAVMRLQEMGVITGSVRREIDLLTEAGAGMSSIWAIVEKEIKRNEGGMKLLSQTADGLRSTLLDARDAMARGWGNNFLEMEKDNIRAAITATEAFTPVIAELGEHMAFLMKPWRLMTVETKKSTGFMDMLATATSGAMKGFILFGSAAVFAQAAVTGSSFLKLYREVGSVGSALKQMIIGTKIAGEVMAGTTIKGRVLGTATKGLAAAWAFLTNILNRSITMMTTGIGGVFSLIGLVVGASYLWYRAAKRQKEELDRLSESQKNQREEMQKMISTATTLQDKMAIEEKAISHLVSAYEALIEARKKGREGFDANNKGIELAQNGVTEAQDALAEAREMNGGKDNRLLEDKVREIKLEQEKKDIIEQGEINRAKGAEKAALMAKRQAALEERANAAKAHRANQIEKEDQKTGDAGRLKELEKEFELRKDEWLNPEKTKTVTQYAGTVEITNEKAKKEAYDRAFAIRQEINLIKERQELERNKAAEMAWDKGNIQLNNDYSNLSSLEVEIENIEQAIKDINQAFAEGTDILSLQNKATKANADLAKAAADQRWSEVAALKQITRDAERNLAVQQRINELIDQTGADPEDATRQANAEANRRDTIRRAEEKDFLRNRQYEIAKSEALSVKDPRKARALDDRKRLNELVQENIMQGNMSAQDARSAAARQMRAEFGASEQSSGSNIVADSFQRLGLGGYAGGSDPAQRARDRMVELQKINNQKLDEILNSGAPM